jgi:hypothetical protein
VVGLKKKKMVVVVVLEKLYVLNLIPHSTGTKCFLLARSFVFFLHAAFSDTSVFVMSQQQRNVT